MLTWLMCWTNLWLAMFHEGAACFLVSEKEGKSAELVQRCEFMFDHIPEARMLKPKVRSKYCLLEFPGLHSYIMGIPEGPSQLRQYTGTSVLFDEYAFWQSAKETLGAARPILENGGRLAIVSSVQDGAFYDLCFDR